MLQNITVFERDSVPIAVAKLAIPTVASMIVTVFYNVVDTFFVGQLGDPNQVAAVSIATPVFLFVMAAGNIFGIGGSSFISRTLGEKKFDKAKHISSFCFYGGIITGIIAMIIFLLYMDPILIASGASNNTIEYARQYFAVVAWGAPFVVLATAYNNLIRGEGSAKTSMTGMMLGTVANIILDPIFILPELKIGTVVIPLLNMGVTGAAIATVLGNIISVIYFLAFIRSGKSILSLRPGDFRIGEGIFTGVIAIGLPASLNNVLMSLSNIMMNKMLVQYGDIAVASMGIAMKANMLVVFIQLGLAAGIQPLTGYNYGAKNYTRMKSVMKFAMVCNVIIGTILTVVYILYANRIVSLFIANKEVIDTGTMILRALMVSNPILGVMFTFTFTFQAMGKAVQSLILSISRQGFVFIPMLFIGRALAGLNGIVYAQPVADLVSICMSVWMFLVMNKNFSTQDNQSPDTYTM
ncbi:MAG TPA: MATE family efflux transporter [Spirochaetia bacterium]|mgnify:CR=1 FL=1|jgi:putative MATE family efflux protein|nr:MATE family efflux transporter [Spirochaetia bacterium]